MDSGVQEKRKVNPRQTANILSKITFWYTRKLFRKGFKQELEEEDLYEVPPEQETSRVGDQIEQEWDLKKHKKFAMFLVFWKLFGIRYCFLGLIMLIPVTISILRPIILGKLVYYFTRNQTELSKSDAYLYGFILIGAHVIDVICRQNYFLQVEVITINVRTAVCSLLYRKLLKLPAHRLGNISFGEITSLITRDVNVFDQFVKYVTHAWTGVIIGIITCYNLYQKIGVPALIAVGAFVLIVPLQIYFGIWIDRLKRATSVKTDERIFATQEALTNIRTIKMYVWEKYIDEKITTFRKHEINILLRLFSLFFCTIISGIILYNITFYFFFMTCIWYGQTLTAETIYFTTGMFYNFWHIFQVSFPYGTFSFAQVITAIKRIQIIVTNLDDQTEISRSAYVKQAKIQLENVTVGTNEKIILKDVNFEVGKGLTLLTGPGSSGKSLLMMTILKEFPLGKGRVAVEGTISHASQEPWLFPSTIRQNIIFGSEYDEKRYRDVIRACALEYDFEFLEKGDLTIVADRGKNLSKGQQSRINLARAVYKKCDVYLLDDCLSSVDNLVARHVFVNCILKFLQDKIVILVTQNTNLVPSATIVLTIENCALKIWKNPSPQELQPIPEEATELIVRKNIAKVQELDFEDNPNSKCHLIERKTIKNKIYREEKETGLVSSNIYKTYIKFGGGFFYCLMIVCIFILTQVSISYKDKLINEWANLEDQISHIANSTNTSQLIFLTQKRNILFYGYTVAIVVLCIGTLTRAISLFFFAKRVSLNLHKKMLKGILNSPLKFFDRNFIGNIVNRFSKDLVSVDENIPFPILHLLAIILETVGNFLLVASVDPKLLIPTAFLFIILVLLRYMYLKTGTPLKRLEGSTKSPVIGYVNATFDGLLSIKVFHAEEILKQEFERHHNLYNSASLLHIFCLKTYAFAVDMFVSIFIAFVVFKFIIFDADVPPGDVGMATIHAFVIGFIIYFGLQKGAELETQMTSAERVMEYGDIKQETKTGLVLKDWPEKAKIIYSNVYLSMNNSNSCELKNINFIINPKERVGIVGRTGSGKSSIISALFQLYELEGKIVIDGIDVKILSLDFLRSKISVIPQDPIVVDGTIRSNIDPESSQTDEKLWEVMETVKLNNLVSSLDMNIKVLDLTFGQKQLISLARVLLQSNKILVLDEIVENVDSETENLIYNILENNFESCTVLIIAHKLKFVLGCDKILVLENGEIVQYDSPEILLQDQNGLFYKMFHGSDIYFNNL